MKKTDNKITTMLSSIMIMLLVVLVIGFLTFRTDNFTTGLKNFYVKNGNTEFVGEFSNFNIVKDKEYRFDVHTTIDIENKASYYVSVVPNNIETTEFAYIVDGTEYRYSEIENLTKGFSIVAYDTYFVFKTSLDLPQIMDLYYPSKLVTDVPSVIDTNIPYFTLKICSADLSETININFNIKSE